MGCAGSAHRAPALPAGTEQRLLFRLEVESAEGRGDLRLVLQRARGGFDLEARDPMGGAIWRLWSQGSEAIWIDLRRGAYCRLDPTQTLQIHELAWALPVRALPDLLEGTFPAATPRPDGEGGWKVEVGGRLFRGFRNGDLWERWTAWDGAEPSAWWRLSDGVSELVLRAPAVRLKWRVVARGAQHVARQGAPELTGLRETECPDGRLP